MEEKKFYSSIKKVFADLPENFSILEEQIDIEIQLKYIEAANKIRLAQNNSACFKKREELFIPEISDERKRELLLGIATVDDVKAFRAIEKFVALAEGDIKQWAVLALQESRMLIQSSLLDEQQVFISTGLGGKGQKLRYYVVFVNKNQNKILTQTQQKLVKDELVFELNQIDGEFETIDFSPGFSTVLVMLPIQSDIKLLFRNVIDECNQYGNFLEDDMIITNVKIMSRIEIIEFLQQNRSNNELEKE